MAGPQSKDAISLSGADWFIQAEAAENGAAERNCIAETKSPGWIPASVPGNIQADLEAAHELKPLWYGAGDPRLADVARTDWWYRRDFELPAGMASRRLKLVFDGVDYACDVWLNGQHLGRNAGMFRRFAFDVAEVIKPGAANQLAVRVERIPTELVHILAASDGPLSGGGPDYPREWGPDFFVHGINQTRQLLKDLKSPTNFGWDWGVNIYTLGIWQDVRLEASGAARIESVQALTDLDDDHRRARVRVKLEVDSLRALRVQAKLRIDGQGATVETSLDADLQSGASVIEAELWLEAPALWWPKGQGEQPLYKLEARLQEAGSGDILHQSGLRIGLRDIRWEQVEGAPADFINPYQLVVNGRPIRMLGSNILPPDLLFGRMNERGERLIRLAAAAGMNTLRVWGGGVFPTDAMFELADELGVMLSQEFPLASCRPETDAVFLGNLETTVRGLVKRYRHHACIIEWSGGNEMWWFQGDDHPALHLLERIVAEEDDRLFRATCPIQGARHSPWHYDPETHYAHYNDKELRDTGWRRGENKMMRYGEFGCHSLAHLEVWQREISPADQKRPYDEDNPVLIRKNVVQAVFTSEHWLLESILAPLFGRIDSLETMLEAGQFLGAHGLRYAVDALRRRGKEIGGLLTWVLNEPWPNGGGPMLVDYDGRPLMTYDFQKQALAPISLSLQYESNLVDPAAGLQADVWLVSDAPAPATDLRWRWLLRDAKGGALLQRNGLVSIEPLETRRLGDIQTGPLKGRAAGPLLAEMQLLDAQGQILSERIELFGLADSPAPLAPFLPGAAPAHQAVDQTVLEAVGLAAQRDGDCDVLRIELANQGAMTALFCEPHPLVDYRVDIDIDPNHAFVPPGETRAITIRAAAGSRAGLSLAQTGWRISCWNAADIVIPPSEDLLFAIGRRDAMTREFLGYDDPASITSARDAIIQGRLPDPAALPYRMDANRLVRFVFDVAYGWEQPARLRLHSADQCDAIAPQLEATVNGRRFDAALSTGLGIQNADPAHLAFPQTATINLPGGALVAGRNTLAVRVLNAGWFTWDSIDLVRTSD